MARANAASASRHWKRVRRDLAERRVCLGERRVDLHGTFRRGARQWNDLSRWNVSRSCAASEYESARPE